MHGTDKEDALYDRQRSSETALWVLTQLGVDKAVSSVLRLTDA